MAEPSNLETKLGEVTGLAQAVTKVIALARRAAEEFAPKLEQEAVHKRPRVISQPSGYRSGVSAPTADELLTIYLRDHHAAGCAGVAMARRAADDTQLVKSRGTLAAVAAEIEEDLESLEAIMASLGVTPSAAKDKLAALGERLGRLKSNGRLLERSALSNVVELEALVAGITAKEALWWSLAESGQRNGLELKQLIDRARRQRTIVERCRRKAVRMAFDDDRTR